ncbi:MAG: glycerate 2-kinase [Frankiaceae bacterium]|nr:glycerate 2-kinase [Frankiaceae bacterium]
MRVLICPDKYRGTATAREAADALAAGARDVGWSVTTLPLADGGEGTLDVLGGATTSTTVTGPLGEPVDAAWRLVGGVAVIEMAQASGLVLAGGAAGNDPLAATTRGTGALIAAALDAGATTVVVGVGGSATTDGGLGAVEVLAPYAPLDGTRGHLVVVACDVTTRFVEAAAVFAPQKGADAEQVLALTRRLESLADEYSVFGIDIRDRVHSGAAGGLAGGLAALGALLQPGFDLVASSVGLREAMASADHVITGEGRLDSQSLEGKVVGGVMALAGELGVACTVVAGDVAHDVPRDGARFVSLVSEYGHDRAVADTAATLTRAARDVLA